MSPIVVNVQDLAVPTYRQVPYGDGTDTGLAQSLREEGLRQPIVITPDWRVLDGGRRLAAMSAQGWAVTTW
jgi:ParB-like chromosome segregation protein Spo0J